MASFRLGPLKSPNRRLVNTSHHTPPFSIDPSQLQVSLEQTQGAPSTPQANRLSGKSSPLRGRCVKEYEEQLQQLQHENFNLKLRVFLLEERVGKALGRSDAADIIKNNIELRVENETLKKSLTEKCQLLAQASSAIEELENQQRSSLAAHQAERLSLQHQLEQLQRELADVEEARMNMGRQSLLPNESTDLYAQAFGSFLLNSQPMPCNNPDHCSKSEIDQFVTQAANYAEELKKLTAEISQSQVQLEAYQERVQGLENDIVQLENDRSEKESKIANLTSILESKSVDGRLNETPQRHVEKDKLIEEKQQQLEQQNKILVEIQITLDEKQKQIAELEGSLSEKKRKVEELEKSLTKAGRTLQGFVTDIQKKEKELEHVRVDTRKKDKRIKDLAAELKEVQELLNKTKWEAEVSGKEDNIKAMAEEENERLWAELEEKKKLLLALEGQLASLRLAVGQKDQSVAEAEMQIANLQRQIRQGQQDESLPGRVASTSRSKSQHSFDSSIEPEQHQQSALAAQLASYIRERNELTETVQLLKSQLASASQNGDTASVFSWKQRYDESKEKAAQLESELERLRAEVHTWKKRAEEIPRIQPVGQDHHIRIYKKEVTTLRRRLVDSTNACDLLRTRLEEMADFLEEVLSMSQQELLNLSNWSAASKRRQALQHSIMQSRELSRSLSQSLMTTMEVDEQQQSNSPDSTSNNGSVRVDQTLNELDGEKENVPPSATEEFGCQVRLDLTVEKTSQLDQLRATVTRLEDQVKERDVEIARMLVKNDSNKNLSAVVQARNQSMQTDQLPIASESNQKKKNLLVSSTPYHRQQPLGPDGRATSFTSPEAIEGGLFPLEATDSILCSAKESISPLKSHRSKGQEGSNAVTAAAVAAAASESEAWSEPDRTVSFARIGLPIQHHLEINSIAALLTTKKPLVHSSVGLQQAGCESSDSSSKRMARRSRSDPCEVKRTGNRIRLLEQENTRLRSQMAELVSCLRSTYDNQLRKEDSLLVADDSQINNSSRQEDGETRRDSIEDISGACDVTTGQFIIEALKNRLVKMKELVKRRDIRLREAKDLSTQLEFKVKEKYFQACENQLLLKETQENLEAKSRQVEQLEARWIEAQSQWMSDSAARDRQASEMKLALDTRDSELRTAQMKVQLWETSYNDGQKVVRQLESDLSDLRSQQEILIQSKDLLEQQVRLLQHDFETVRDERDKLRKDLANLKEQSSHGVGLVCNKSPVDPSQSSRRRSSNSNAGQGIQRQASQMSDYVSDQAVSEDQADPPSQAGKSKEERPSVLHLSPDLGIDSDQGRFSSLEHSAKEVGSFSSHWNTNKASPKKTEATQEQEHDLSPDVLNTSSCANCPRWQNKYIKAKQTLAATLEKLQAANLRKEKVDRALNKELGKTHNILCQARGLLEQANQGSQ